MLVSVSATKNGRSTFTETRSADGPAAPAIIAAVAAAASQPSSFTSRTALCTILSIHSGRTSATPANCASAGEKARCMYVLAEGAVEILASSTESDDPLSLATLIPPCSFGEVAFFENSSHTATVRTVTSVRVISIDRASYDRLLARQSMAAYKFALNVLLKLGDQVLRVESWVVDELQKSSGIGHAQWEALRAKLYQGLEI